MRHPDRTTLLHVASLVVARIAATAAVLWLGFEALSDDDFARVTLAQRFAAHPTLDPTGTSWLPFPFWLDGTVMALFGPSLAVARWLSGVIACVSSVLVYSAARSAGVSPRAAWVSTLLWTLLPVGVYAGAATVPELSTAALCASSLLLVRRSDLRAAFAAASLVLPATLSRYEAWPVAMAVMVSIGIPSKGVRTLQNPGGNVAARAAAMALAAAGPVLWMLWNWYDHGDPMHFHARVSAYWFASGGEAKRSLAEVLAYPKTVILDAPVLFASLIGAAFWSRQGRTPAQGLSHLRHWLRPVLGAAFVVLALTLAQGTGGAPTHHPERTLLLVWAVGWMATADLIAGAAAPSGKGWTLWRRIWLLAVISFLAVRTHSVASWYGVRRTDEVRLGHWLRDHTQGPILVEPPDYGYFAVMAALGTPDRIVLGSSVDPRARKQPSPFESEGTLQQRATDDGARWVAATGEAAGIASRLGRERATIGRWRVVQLSEAGRR